MGPVQHRNQPRLVTEFWRRMPGKSLRIQAGRRVGIEERLAAEGLAWNVGAERKPDPAANQVSVGNSISSLRFLDAMNWREFVETLSAVDRTLRSDPADVYGDMDFATRDTYRHAVERIARHGTKTESESLSSRSAWRASGSAPLHRAKRMWVTFSWTRDCRSRASRRACGRPSDCGCRRLARRYALPLYLSASASASVAIGAPLDPPRSRRVSGPPWLPPPLTVLVLLAASQLALALVNWMVSIRVRPTLLPPARFLGGIPPDCRTMVVVPTLLTQCARHRSPARSIGGALSRQSG